MDWKNILERAAWTFVEAFLVALPTTITSDIDGAGWVSALLAGACAGLSAVKTLLIEIIKKKNAETKSEDNGEI